MCIAGLHPQSLRHFALQPSVRVSQSLWCYLSHMIAAILADEYWHLLCSDWRKKLIYAHKTSRALPRLVISAVAR
jgi:hypothetical protein